MGAASFKRIISYMPPRNVKGYQKFYFWLFLGPTIIYLFVWKFIPLLYTIFLSFTSWNPLKGGKAVLEGIGNYVQLLKDGDFIHSLYVTLAFTLAATLLEFILGLIIALLLDDGIRGRNIYTTIILIPMVIAPAVVGTIWHILYHETIGPLNYLFKGFGLQIGWLRNPKLALPSIILTDIWHWMPFMFLLILSGLQVIPRELYESAGVDGANWFQTLLFVKLPQLRNTMAVAVIMRSMDAFRVFDEIMLMTGGGPGNSTETTSILIYKNAFKFFELGYSSTLVVVLLAMSLLMYLSYMKYIRID